MKVRDITRDSCSAERRFSDRSRDFHHLFKHPLTPGRVTVAGHPSDDIAPGTLNSIRKQARWKE
ncbi:MAG: addiction module toxin, HicA family [Acidobacteria bacterium]|nr:MAG: addiction module toxin, HicA family [Acidobacteriota bacterium]